MRKIMIFALIVLLFAPIASAKETKELPELVTKFYDAVKTRDRVSIEKAYQRLSANKKVLEQLKKDHPEYFTLYEFWTAAFKAQDYRDQAGSNVIASSPEDSTEFIPTRNRSIEGAHPSRRSNQSIVASYPNQNRPSNQVSIRRRLRSQR